MFFLTIEEVWEPAGDCRRAFRFGTAEIAFCGPAALSSTSGPAARCLAASDQRTKGRIVGEFCFQLVQRCRRELAGSVQHHNGWLTVALLDAQPAFDVGKQCLGAAWDSQSSRDLGGGAAHGQIPDLALQGVALLLKLPAELGLQPVVLLGPALLEFFDVSRLARSLFTVALRLFFGFALQALGFLGFTQECRQLSLHARDVFLLRQTLDAQDELAVLLGVHGRYGFIDAFKAVQFVFQGHCCLPETLSRPCLRIQKSPGSARAWNCAPRNVGAVFCGADQFMPARSKAIGSRSRNC